jgi:hypothetical protein
MGIITRIEAARSVALSNVNGTSKPRRNRFAPRFRVLWLATPAAVGALSGARPGLAAHVRARRSQDAATLCRHAKERGSVGSQRSRSRRGPLARRGHRPRFKRAPNRCAQIAFDRVAKHVVPRTQVAGAVNRGTARCPSSTDTTIGVAIVCGGRFASSGLRTLPSWKRRSVCCGGDPKALSSRSRSSCCSRGHRRSTYRTTSGWGGIPTARTRRR